MSYWKEEMKSIKEKKRTFYHSPLPKSKQRCNHCRGRSKKCYEYTEEEIFLENLKRFPNQVLQLWGK